MVFPSHSSPEVPIIPQESKPIRTRPTPDLQGLPRELLSMIFSNLRDADKVLGARVSRRLKDVIDADPEAAKQIVQVAIVDGNINVLNYLKKEKALPLKEETFQKAAFAGNLESLKWLKDNKCPFDAYRLQKNLLREGKNNLPAVLNFLKTELGVEFNEFSYSYAIEYGNHEAIKTLYEDQKIPLLSAHCLCASNSDRLDILKWLLAHGAPWDDEIIEQAANDDIRNWAIDYKNQAS